MTVGGRAGFSPPHPGVARSSGRANGPPRTCRGRGRFAAIPMTKKVKVKCHHSSPTVRSLGGDRQCYSRWRSSTRRHQRLQSYEQLLRYPDGWRHTERHVSVGTIACSPELYLDACVLERTKQQHGSPVGHVIYQFVFEFLLRREVSLKIEVSLQCD